MNSMTSDKTDGILILAHGSRASEVSYVLQSIMDKVKSKWSYCPIYTASLQFEHPDIEEAVNTMVGKGIKRIVMVPLFLFPGNHMQIDIPALIDRIKKHYPNTEIVLSGYIGDDDRIADIVIDKALEGVARLNGAHNRP